MLGGDGISRSQSMKLIPRTLLLKKQASIKLGGTNSTLSIFAPVLGAPEILRGLVQAQDTLFHFMDWKVPFITSQWP